MYDGRKLLGLLCSMPKQLNTEHLKQIQEVIDADRAKDENQGGEQNYCGNYASFCEGCNKNLKFPCAVAYIDGLCEKEGLDAVITVPRAELLKDGKIDDSAANEAGFPAVCEQNEDEAEDTFEEQAPSPETVSEISESETVEEGTDISDKKIFRIALAKRKNNT